MGRKSAFLVFSFIFLFSAGFATTAQAAVKPWIKFTTAAASFKQIWKGGSNMGTATYYKVLPDGDFKPLGDMMTVGAAPSLNAMLIALPPEDPKALAHPTGFEWKGDDKGSGNSSNLHYWQMIAPTGYVSLGYCFTDGPYGGGTPEPVAANYWCVSKKYLLECDVNLFFSDAGTGFKHHNFDLYEACRKTGQKPSDGNVFLLPTTRKGVDDQRFSLLNVPVACVDLPADKLPDQKHPQWVKYSFDPATFKEIWRGLSNAGEAVYYKILPEGDFRPLGDMMILGGSRELSVMLLAPSPNDPKALAHPTGFTWRGDDKGSGNSQSLHYWQMIAPVGYVSLGYCFTNGPYGDDTPKPIADNYWCVSKKYLSECNVRGYFSDAGTKFKHHDLNLYEARRKPKQNAATGNVLLFPTTCKGKDDQSYSLLNVRIDSVDLLSTDKLTDKQIVDAVNKYAPIIRFYPEEEYLPTSIEDFISKAEPRPEGEEIIGLKLKASAQKYAGNLGLAKAYVNVKKEQTYTDLQYWFLYGYNGAGYFYRKYLGNGKVYDTKTGGQHEGDWETITVRISNKKNEPLAVCLSQHGDGQWHPAGEVMKNGRVVFYASHSGHAAYKDTGMNLSNEHNYKWKGIGAEFATVNDTADGGTSFDTQKKCQIIAVHDYLGNEEKAGYVVPNPGLKYKGRWGNVLINKSPDFGDLPIEAKTYVQNNADALKEFTEEYGPEVPWGEGKEDSWKYCQ